MKKKKLASLVLAVVLGLMLSTSTVSSNKAQTAFNLDPGTPPPLRVVMPCGSGDPGTPPPL